MLFQNFRLCEGVRKMKLRCIVTLCLIATFAFSQTAFAENEAFLCIPEIPGGTADTRNPDCIDIKSLSVDFSLDSSYLMGSGGAAGAPTISPFTIVKHHDVASVKLQEYLLMARHLPSVLIRFFESCEECEPAEYPYLVYTLEEVVITRHNTSYFEGAPTNSEIVDLSFAKYLVCAGTNLSDGCDNGEFRWNLREGKAE